MKRIIIILVVLALFGVGAYYFFLKMTAEEPRRCEDGFRFDPAAQNCIPVDIPIEEKELDLSVVEVQIPNSLIRVKLQKDTQGVFSSTYTDPEFPAVKGFISVKPETAVDFSESLVLVPMIMSSGGTGQFSYVGLFDKKENKHLSSLFVDDRVAISSIEVVDEIVKINYKTRAASQSYGDQPTVPAQIAAQVKDTVLVQIMKLNNSDYSQVEIKSPLPNSTVSGDFAVKGSMPGFWYFEAIAQFKIVDSSYNEIAVGTIQSLSDWMTEQRVPFELKLNSGNFSYKGEATIIIQSENVQGDIEGELKVKKMEIPFVIK